jgi:hypothetical protein
MTALQSSAPSVRAPSVRNNTAAPPHARDAATTAQNARHDATAATNVRGDTATVAKAHHAATAVPSAPNAATMPNARDEAMAPLDVRERRRRRAAVATRLATGNADAVAVVDWHMLDAAPAWLALRDAELATLQRRIGALLYAPEIRLWIDHARLAAARTALGETFMQALLAQRDLLAFPIDAGARPRINAADQVPVQLQLAGAAVLLASLPQGPLRQAMSTAWTTVAAAPMAAELAQSYVTRGQSLATPLPAAKSSADRRGAEGAERAA